MSEPARALTRCRICRDETLRTVLTLGNTPLANAFVRPENLGRAEPVFPLELLRCSTCGLVQLSIVVRPDVLFGNYLYASSASPPLLSHFGGYAREVAERFAPPSSLVVEIGSNDGVLLRPLTNLGIRAVGVEPAANLARAANEAGLETWNEFFSADLARRIAARCGRARAILANNVLAHIDDLGGVLGGLDALLDADGVFVAEFPYLADLVEHVEYDTIYHEHLSYFSLEPLERLFSTTDMEIFDVRRMPLHGGSLRLFVGRKGRYPVEGSVRELRLAELNAGLRDEQTYVRLAEEVRLSRETIGRLLRDLKERGKRVAALGATAKGNTLLNYCGLGPTYIDYVADSTPQKQGLYTPGTHIPVRPERTILDDRPDYTLLLAWNYADAILDRFHQYLNDGGRFIHPIPVARVIG